MEQVTLTRRELYDLVWSTPMTAIAKKYLISDVGLRKICISMNIPLPRAEHWEKIKAGKPVHDPGNPVRLKSLIFIHFEPTNNLIIKH